MISIDVPIYHALVLVSLSDNPNKARKSAEAVSVFGPAPAVRDEVIDALCAHTDDGRFGLFLDPDNLSVNTLAHELFHLSIHLADCYGITVDPQNHEAVAYLHGWLAQEVDKVLTCYRKRKTTRKRRRSA